MYPQVHSPAVPEPPSQEVLAQPHLAKLPPKALIAYQGLIALKVEPQTSAQGWDLSWPLEASEALEDCLDTTLVLMTAGKLGEALGLALYLRGFISLKDLWGFCLSRVNLLTLDPPPTAEEQS